MSYEPDVHVIFRRAIVDAAPQEVARLQRIDEFEARVAQAAPMALRDRWVQILRDEVDGAVERAKSYPAPTRWFTEEACDFVLQAVLRGASPDDYRPIRDVTPPKMLNAGDL